MLLFAVFFELSLCFRSFSGVILYSDNYLSNFQFQLFDFFFFSHFV
nr:MAG TPA: hypothetical protein [Caudoviricetes sp.]